MKPKVTKKKTFLGTAYWYWQCPWINCPAPTHETYGSHPIWEIVLRSANDHAERHHHHHEISHDLPTW